jgi:hypothetical protein
MALTYPADPTNSAYIRKGTGRLYLGAWVTGGADANPLVDLGPTQGDIGFTYKKSMKVIECDQFLNGIGAFPSKEEFDLKATFIDLTLANWYRLVGSSVRTITGGDRADNSGSVGLGEENAIKYWQLVWRGFPPASSSATISRIQCWRVIVTGASEVKFGKAKESSLQVTFMPLTDPTAILAGKDPIGAWVEA